jgi:hypothetical protein
MSTPGRIYTLSKTGECQVIDSTRLRLVFGLPLPDRRNLGQDKFGHDDLGSGAVWLAR